MNSTRHVKPLSLPNLACDALTVHRAYVVLAAASRLLQLMRNVGQWQPALHFSNILERCRGRWRDGLSLLEHHRDASSLLSIGLQQLVGQDHLTSSDLATVSMHSAHTGLNVCSTLVGSLDNGEPDERTLHEGVPPSQGIKYAINGWMRSKHLHGW